MASTDLSKRVIFKMDDGSIAMKIPSPEFLENHTIEDVAKTLPVGVKYKIIDVESEEYSLLFANRDYWKALEVDESDLDSGEGEAAYFGRDKDDQN